MIALLIYLVRMRCMQVLVFNTALKSLLIPSHALIVFKFLLSELDRGVNNNKNFCHKQRVFLFWFYCPVKDQLWLFKKHKINWPGNDLELSRNFWKSKDTFLQEIHMKACVYVNIECRYIYTCTCITYIQQIKHIYF